MTLRLLLYQSAIAASTVCSVLSSLNMENNANIEINQQVLSAALSYQLHPSAGQMGILEIAEISLSLMSDSSVLLT